MFFEQSEQGLGWKGLFKITWFPSSHKEVIHHCMDTVQLNGVLLYFLCIYRKDQYHLKFLMAQFKKGFPGSRSCHQQEIAGTCLLSIPWQIF